MESLLDAVGGAWARLTTGTPVPGQLAIVVALIAAGVASARGPLWQPLHVLVAIAHECGHAAAAVLTRRSVLRVQINSDGSGTTHTSGRVGGIGAGLVAFAGYPFPAILGAGFLVAVATGTARIWAAAAATALVVLLMRTRNLHGWVVVLVWLAALAAAAWYLPGGLLALAMTFLGASLLFGAGRSLLAERRARRAGESGSDVTALARGGRVPAGLWWATMFGVVLCCGWVAWDQLSASRAGL